TDQIKRSHESDEQPPSTSKKPRFDNPETIPISRKKVSEGKAMTDSEILYWRRHLGPGKGNYQKEMKAMTDAIAERGIRQVKAQIQDHLNRTGGRLERSSRGKKRRASHWICPHCSKRNVGRFSKCPRCHYQVKGSWRQFADTKGV